MTEPLHDNYEYGKSSLYHQVHWISCEKKHDVRRTDNREGEICQRCRQKDCHKTFYMATPLKRFLDRQSELESLVTLEHPSSWERAEIRKKLYLQHDHQRRYPGNLPYKEIEKLRVFELQWQNRIPPPLTQTLGIGVPATGVPAIGGVPVTGGPAIDLPVTIFI